MRQLNQKGLTLVEIVLFLAISGLFLLVAFAGIRGRTSAVQFTDSMRSLQSFLVSEENKLLNGVNSTSTAPTDCTPANTGESGDCVLIGRVLTFGEDSSGALDPSSITISVLYGDRLNPEDILAVGSSSDIELIEASDPRPDDSIDNYEISWGTDFRLNESINEGDTTQNYNRIGWLRSPSSSRIVPISLSTNAPSIADSDNYKSGAAFSKIGDEVETRLCFEGTDGQPAAIYFGDGNGNPSITLEFDAAECKP